MRKLAMALALTAMAAPGSAAVITFDELHNDGPTVDTYHQLVSGGFLFVGTRPDGAHSDVAGISVWQSLSPFNPDPDGAAIYSDLGGLLVTVRREDGGLFDLASIDIGDKWNGRTGSAGSIVFTFADALGVTTQQMVTVGGAQTLRTVQLDRSGLRSFSYQTFSGSVSAQIDNVVVEPLAISAVPEPATWAMMIGGLGLTGGAVRRARRGRPASSALC